MKPQFSLLIVVAVSAVSSGQSINRFTPTDGPTGGNWSIAGLWSELRIADSNDIVQLSGRDPLATNPNGYLQLAGLSRQIKRLDLAAQDVIAGQRFANRVRAGSGAALSLTLTGDQTGEFVRLHSRYTSGDTNDIFTLGPWREESATSAGTLTVRLIGRGDFVIEDAQDTLDVRSVIANTPLSTPATVVKRGPGSLHLGGKAQDDDGEANTFTGGFELHEGLVFTRQRTDTTLFWTRAHDGNAAGTAYTFTGTKAFGEGTFTAIGGKLDLNGFGILNPVDLQTEIAFTRSETGRKVSALGGNVVISGASGTIRVDDANQDPVSDDGDESENTSAHQELHVFGRITGGTLVKEGRRRLYISGLLEQREGGVGLDNGNDSTFSALVINQGEVVPSEVNNKNTPGPLGTGMITLNGGKLGYYKVTTGQSATPNFVPTEVSETDREVVIGSNHGEIQVGHATTGGSYDLRVRSISGPGTLTKTGPDFLRTDKLESIGGVVVSAGTLSVGWSQSGDSSVTASISGAGTLVKTGTSGLTVAHFDNLGTLSISAGSVTIPASATSTSRVRALAVSSGATLDLTNNDFILDYTGTSPVSAIRQSLASAYHAGDWTGTGITSSVVAGDVGQTPDPVRTGIGYAEASVLSLTSFSGQSVDSTTIVMRYTWAGDADLDQDVDFVDLLKNSQNYGLSGKEWWEGDSTYDGSVNFIDLLYLSQNYGKGQSELPGDSVEALPGPAIVYLELYHSFPHIIDDARNHEELWALFKPWEYLTSGASEFVYVPVLPTLMPEPGTMALVVGAGAIGLTRRRATVR